MSWLANPFLKEEKQGKKPNPKTPSLVPSFQSQQLFDRQHQTWRMLYKRGNTLYALHTRAHNPNHARKRMMLEWFALGGQELQQESHRKHQPLTVKCRDVWSKELEGMESAINLGWMEQMAPDRLHIFKLDFHRGYHPGCMMVQAHNVVEARQILLQAVEEKDVDDNTFPYATSFDDKKTLVQVNPSPNPTVPMSSDMADLTWAIRLGYLEMVAQSVMYFCALDG
jgi:hypothetical protein